MKDNEVTYQNKKNMYITKAVIYTVLFCICFLSLGYSAFSNTLSIEGALASIRPTSSVRITGVNLSNTSNGGIGNSENYNKEEILGNITLPNSNSTVTYKVSATVFLSQEMKITNITGLDSHLEYAISDYTFGDILCNSNNECNLGATKEFYITFSYKSGEYDGVNTTFPISLTVVFESVNFVAKIGNTRYQTLQAAFNDVPNNNTQTTVQLLMNTSEVLTINTGQNITLNFNGNTISNSGGNPVITNTGTLRMSDGTINTSAAQGAINNNTGGLFIMSGGTISATGEKQALYNDGGRAEISGGTLTNRSTNRASVHNLNNGVLIITGGTITASRFHGVYNVANMTIGTKDNNASVNSLTITGEINGVNSTTNFNYYDGTIIGYTDAFNDETKITDSETGLSVIHVSTRINNKTYDSAHLGIGVTLTFNLDGGTMSENNPTTVESGQPIGILPVPEKTDFVFDAWYDAPSGGNKVTKNTVITSNTTIYARWIDVQDYSVAKIGNTNYATIQEAVSAVANNTQTTILITRDVDLEERISIGSSKRIVFDLQGHTITNGSAVIPLFENTGGIVTIQNGTLESNTSQGAVNNKNTSSNMTINNMTIRAIGTRQALYNEKGTTTITGNSVLSNVSNERAAVHNLQNGKVIITSATITSSNFSAIANDSGTITIGVKDGNISTSSVTVQGSVYGINNSGTFNFYDGLLKGLTNAINGSVNDTDGTVTNGTDGNYETAYLQ